MSDFRKRKNMKALFEVEYSRDGRVCEGINVVARNAKEAIRRADPLRSLKSYAATGVKLIAKVDK